MSECSMLPMPSFSMPLADANVFCSIKFHILTNIVQVYIKKQNGPFWVMAFDSLTFFILCGFFFISVELLMI